MKAIKILRQSFYCFGVGLKRLCGPRVGSGAEEGVREVREAAAGTRRPMSPALQEQILLREFLLQLAASWAC